MRKLALPMVSLVAALLTAALPVSAHVTPNVELVKKGEFIQQSLPGAARFFEEKLALSAEDRAAIRRATGWVPGDEDARIYVGRDAERRRVGTVVLLWMPSQHGPVGVAVAFGAEARVRRAAVTDVGSEPLAWVRPLVEAGGLAAFEGLALDAKPDPAKVAPQVAGRMNRYYAEVVAQAVARAQALERLSIAAGR
jgi:hypothetical protein